MYFNQRAFLLGVAKPLSLILWSEISSGGDSTKLASVVKIHAKIMCSQGFIINNVYVDNERVLVNMMDAINLSGIKLIVSAKGDCVRDC